MAKYTRFEPVELLASGAVTATSTGTDAVRLFEGLNHAQACVFVLDLTAAATDVDDTLDVFIQTRIDGSNWVDIVHFTQVLGNGLDDLTYIAKVAAADGEPEFEIGTALAANTVRNLLGIEFRTRYDVVDSGDSDQSFTFSVTAIPQ